MLFLVLVADCFVLVFNRFLFFRFSLVSVFSIFFVLVFVNGIVIFSFLVIFVFANENHTGHHACIQATGEQFSYAAHVTDTTFKV